MKRTKKRYALTCLLCMAVIFASAVPVFGVSFSTDGFFTTLEVREDASMHVTEEIYITCLEPMHGIYRYIPIDNANAYFMYGGELQSKELYYKIRNVRCEGEELVTETMDDELMIRIGSADKYITGKHKYTIEYDVVMYEDGIDYLDQLYWNVIPGGWQTDIEFAAFTVHMPKTFETSSVDVITGPVGTGDDTRASWEVSDGSSLYGHVDALERYEGVTVRIVLPEGYWQGVKSETLIWRIAQIAMGALVCFAVGLFMVKGRDPKPVKTVEFYPPDDLPPAEIGFIYDNRLSDKDMTSMVMWFAAQGYLKIHAEEDKGGFLKKDKVHIKLQKLRELPIGAPSYQKRFFDALFDESVMADMEELTKSTNFADDYQQSKQLLQDRYGYKTKRNLQEGYGSAALGCLTGLLMVGLVVLAVIFLNTSSRNMPVLLAEFGIGGVIVFLCTIFMSRPTAFRLKLLGRIKGFREFIQMAEADRIDQLVETDPDYFYNILPYAYVFGLTDKWARHFERLAVAQPSWYEGPATYISMPAYFCDAMDKGVRSSLSESIMHTSSSDFSGGGSYSSGGGGFSGGGGGGGGGGGW